MVSILIVDDEFYTRDRLKEIVENNGYEAEVAIDEDDAKIKIEKGKYNVVITDMKMRRSKGGLEVIRIAKNKHPSTQVIVISGTLDDDIANECIQAGAFSYLRRQDYVENLYEIAFLEIKRALLHSQSQGKK